MIAAERWLPVVGYEGLYLVSDRGRIYRLTTQRGGPRLSHIQINYNGYPCVRMTKARVRKCKLVHALVAAAFIGPRPTGLTVNHKNAVRTDNRVENLEYLTQGDNMRHAASLGLIPRGERCHFSSLTEAQVVSIRERMGSTTQANLAAEFTCSQATISDIKRRKSWKHIQRGAQA